jgi:uncharacterized membrane protein HdeD (DUF308 family)
METEYSKYWYLLFFKGIILIVLGLLVLLAPRGDSMAYALYFGIGFLFAGVFRIFHGYYSKNFLDSWKMTVSEGILDIIMGVIFLIHPVAVDSHLPDLWGIYAAIYGIIKVIAGMNDDEGKGLKYTIGAITIVLGILVYWHPAVTGIKVALWFASLLVIVGVLNIVLAFSIKD